MPPDAAAREHTVIRSAETFSDKDSAKEGVARVLRSHWLLRWKD